MYYPVDRSVTCTRPGFTLCRLVYSGRPFVCIDLQQLAYIFLSPETSPGEQPKYQRFFSLSVILVIDLTSHFLGYATEYCSDGTVTDRQFCDKQHQLSAPYEFGRVQTKVQVTGTGTGRAGWLMSHSRLTFARYVSCFSP